MKLKRPTCCRCGQPIRIRSFISSYLDKFNEEAYFVHDYEICNFFEAQSCYKRNGKPNLAESNDEIKEPNLR